MSQGKYEREILGKFHMEGCKPMDTSLPKNWRKEDATSGEVVDATIYRQLVGSLMYLVYTRPDICYAVNQLNQAMVKPTKIFLEGGEGCLEIPKGHIKVWFMVQTNGCSEVAWLHRCRLGGQSIK